MSISRSIAATAALLVAAAAASGEDAQPPTAPPAASRPAPRKPLDAEKPQLQPGMPLRAGSFPRSFLIPGTDTSLSIGGH
jgi:hypothetical protein